MDGVLSYSFNSSVYGAPWEFELKPEGLKWTAGRRSGLLDYDKIRGIRLSFRPATMQSYRFQAEIWAEEMPKIQIASTSWRGMVEQRRQDAAYTAFIVELHRRLAGANSRAQFSTGIPSIKFWSGLAIFVVFALGLAALTLKAVLLGEWGGAALVGGFFGLFVWQLGRYFQYNWPQNYSPDAVPANVLPRG